MGKKRKDEPPVLVVAQEDATSTYELERYILGTILNDATQLSVIAERLTSHRFSSLAHATIFNALLSLESRKFPIDFVPLLEELRNQQTLEAVGGVEYLSSLIDKTIYPDNVPAYCKMINDKWVLREINRLADEVKTESRRPGVEAFDILDGYRAKLEEVDKGTNRTGFETAYPLQLIEGFGEPESIIETIPSGFSELDKLMNGGFERGRLTILGAESKLGKTILSGNFAVNIARRIPNIRVHYMMLVEMDNWEIMSRWYAMVTGIPQAKIYRKQCEKSELIEVATEFEQMRTNNRLKLFCSPSRMSINSIRLNMRKEGGADVIVIDQSNKLTGYEDKDDVKRISLIAQDVKCFAREENVHVIMPVQLNRPEGQNENQKPTARRLYGGSGFEQECDTILFIYAPNAHKPIANLSDEEMMERRLIISKIRNGTKGEVVTRFRGIVTRFEEIEVVRELTESPRFRKHYQDDDEREF